MSGSGIDASVERLGRWTAKRTTRRSFVHGLGKFLVVMAAGPALATLLVRTASARVCGQTGVTKKCTTFACEGPGHVWGWCWYASDGCCQNEGLKKICDCCVENYPNVHGYCPAGTNVACIVESCGEDPRVTPVEMIPLEWSAEHGYTGAALDAAHAEAHRVVVADADTWWRPVVAAPLAGALGSPFMQATTDGLTVADQQRLTDLGVQVAMVVGPQTSTTINHLTTLGIQIELVSSSDDASQASVEVAERLRSINAINRSVTLPADVGPGATAELIGVFAASSGFAVAYDTAAADLIGMPTVIVGTDQPSVSGEAETIEIDDVDALARRLAELGAVSPFVETRHVIVVPEGTADLVGLANLGLPVVLHPDGELGTLPAWLEARGLANGKWDRVYLVRGPGELSAEEYWRLQGTVNGFRVDDLMGESGDGLPVISQPLSERPIGLARVDGSLPWGSEPEAPYWTQAAQTFRGN